MSRQGRRAITLKRSSCAKKRRGCLIPSTPTNRRLRYLRYADNFVLSFSGPKAEVQVGSNHGRTTALDPPGLPDVPSEHPRQQLETA